MTVLTLPEIARALGGQVAGRQVLAPGPGHSRRDRSLAIKPAVTAPGGFVVTSYADDDWRECRDYVAQRLGLPRFDADRETWNDPIENMRRRAARALAEKQEAQDRARNEARARARLAEAGDPRGSVVEAYLRSRNIEIPEHMAGVTILYHPACPWLADDGTLTRVHAMLLPLVNLATGQVVGAHRTALTSSAEKIGRKVLGTAAGCVIQLEPATEALTIGEGLETSLSARAIGFRPVWAAYSVNEIARLPVIDGVTSLTLLGERDATGANARAVDRCGSRWHAAGRDVQVAMPLPGFGDFNDQLCGVRT